MFFYYIFSAYLIPGVYSYFRINSLLIPKGKKLAYTLLFILVFAGFPVAEKLAHYETTLNLVPLIKLGLYTMPVMLYLFLLVLVFDLFLLLNLACRWLPKGFLKRNSFRKWGLISAIGIPILILVYGMINFNLIRISEYNVEIPQRSSHLNNLTIAFVCDFHIGGITKKKFVERFVDKMNSLDPDIILFGGDLLEGDRDDLGMEKIEKLFQQINAPYGKFGVYGNHEHHGRQSSDDFYRNAGITLLHDGTVFIDNLFYLIGRQDAGNEHRATIRDLTNLLIGGYPILVIDHRPTDIDAVKETKVDLQFSGHTHHGQLFPFNLITKKMYEISWGHRKIKDTHFFVSSGIQLWGPPVRTIGKSEIMLVNVHLTD